MVVFVTALHQMDAEIESIRKSFPGRPARGGGSGRTTPVATGEGGQTGGLRRREERLLALAGASPPSSRLHSTGTPSETAGVSSRRPAPAPPPPSAAPLAEGRGPVRRSGSNSWQGALHSILDALSMVDADSIQDYLETQNGVDVTTEEDAVRLLHVVKDACLELNHKMLEHERQLVEVQEEENQGLMVASDMMKRGLEKNREYVDDLKKQQAVIDGLMVEVEEKQQELEDRSTQLKRLQRESAMLRERVRELELEVTQSRVGSSKLHRSEVQQLREQYTGCVGLFSLPR